LRQLSDVFPEAPLRDDPEILNIVVTEAKKAGDRLVFPQPVNGSTTARIVGREITERYGIRYTIETPDGSRFTHEFYD
jgi:hypothetical protein